jgi:hyaluronan synthase
MLPLVAFMTIFVALFVKAYALLTMNRQGWLTRRTDLLGGEGQSASSLARGPVNG